MNNPNPATTHTVKPAGESGYAWRLARDTFSSPGAMLGLIWTVTMILLAVFAPYVANSMPIVAQKADGTWISPMLRYLTTTDAVLMSLLIGGLALLCFQSLKAGLRLLLFAYALIASLAVAGWAPTCDWLMRSYPSMVQHLEPMLSPTMLTVVSLAIAVLALVILAIWIGAMTIGNRTRLLLFLWLAVILAPWVANPINPPALVIYDDYRIGLEDGAYRQCYWTLIPYSPLDYLADEHAARLRDMSRDKQTKALPPSTEHWLGTDIDGCDVASRMIHATRIALSVGFVATSIALIIGIIIGGLMGYYAGWVDILGMRLVEMFSAIPTMFLLLAFVAFYGKNLFVVLIILGVTGWVGYAIFIRAEFLRLRKMEFVQAAQACGLPLRSILFRHMLPNGIAPTLVTVSFNIAGAILGESILSFLGLVEAASWGQLLSQMIAEGGGFHWWIAITPGLAIFLTVFSYNLIGESLRDALDPHTRKQAL